MDKYSIQRRFWVRVIPDASGCWFWIGGIRANGYGTFAVKNGERWTQTTAHRFAYLDQVGEIPDSYEIDHLCCVRRCVRPDHLEAVTVQENRRRRDEKQVFNIDTSSKDCPIIPPKPIKQTIPKIPKSGPSLFCPNGHEYTVVGQVSNGSSFSKPRFTCAACRKAGYAKNRKGNYARDRTQCPQGHPYSGDNLISKIKTKNGRQYNARECRACTRLRNRLAHRRKALLLSKS